MRITLTVLAAILVLATPVQAELVQVEITGTVEYNQFTGTQFAAVIPGDAFSWSFIVDSENYVDGTTYNTRGYVIDEASFVSTVGPAVHGLQDPQPDVPYFVIRESDPVADGFFFASGNVDWPYPDITLDEAGILGQCAPHFEVGYDGTTLTSLDILDAVGTHDYTALTSFYTVVMDGWAEPLGLEFGQMTISLVGAPCTVEDFEDGVADNGWTFGNSNDIVEATGGNPGMWLHNPSLDTFGPNLRTDYYAPDFTGNYREMGVTTISFDARIDDISFGPVPIEMTVLLRNTHGTPEDVNDDDYAYFPGQLIPVPGEGWVHYEFIIPSASLEAVPAGWFGGWVGDPENFRPGVEWSDVVTSVDRLEIWYWHPAYSGIFQNWDVGVDNISLCFGGPDFSAALDITPETGTLPFQVTITPQICNLDEAPHQYYGQFDLTLASSAMIDDWRHGTVTVMGNECKSRAFPFNLPECGALIGDNLMTMTVENLDTGVTQSTTAVVTAN